MTQRYVILCVVALLAASTSALAWAGKGQQEPNTAADRADGFMWLSNNPTTSRKVYFNGFLTDVDAGQGISVSPNVAMLETTVLPRRAAPYAMLGVWQDCNGDGYIGNGEAQHQYPVQQLPATGTFCTPTPGVYPTHNDGSFIYEYIPLVYRNQSDLACCDANIYVDNHAKAWLDHGLQLDPTTGAGCTVPPNAYQTTGGVLAYLDCNAEYAVTGAINTAAAAAGRRDLGFSDKPNGRQGESTSPLNQPIPTGNGEDESYAQVWDCSDKSKVYNVKRDNPTPFHENPTGIHIVDILGQVKVNVTGIWNYATDRNVNPNLRTQPTTNTGGSFWGTVNETENAWEDCDRDDPSIIYSGGLDTMDRCPPAALPCESLGWRQFTGRIRPDFRLSSASWNATYGEGFTSDMIERDHVGTSYRQFWFGPTIVMNGPVARDLSGIQTKHFTFYGFVSPGAVSKYTLLLPGTTGAYGAEACAQTAIDGVTRFDCNRDNWWKRTDGSEISPRDSGWNAGSGSAACFDFETKCDPRTFVGDPYNLRDIDCYDFSAKALRDEGVSTGTVTGRYCK